MLLSIFSNHFVRQERGVTSSLSSLLPLGLVSFCMVTVIKGGKEPICRTSCLLLRYEGSILYF